MCGERRFVLAAQRPLLMGILNVTPDSFSDGNCFFDPDHAIAHGEAMHAAGADIVDVGGESTRPGADPVSEAEELKRVRPVVRALAGRGIAVSIDTYKAAVAREAVEAGACIVNDVGAGLWDEAMVPTVAGLDAGYVCMHAQGRPSAMQENPAYTDVVAEVGDFLAGRLDVLKKAGVEPERVLPDAGIGFGKKLEHNLALLRQAAGLSHRLQRPMLWGLSRKSFISHALGVEAGRRGAGSLAAHAWLLAQGQGMVWRVHDVEEVRQVVEMWVQIHHA